MNHDMTTDFRPTRRLILKGAASVALIGARQYPLRRHAGAWPRPTTNIRKTRSSRRARPMRSRRCMARPPSHPTRSSSTRRKSPRTARWCRSRSRRRCADVTSISFLVAENPNALAASYQIPPGTMPSVANRLKMAKTSNVIAIVEAGGKLYSATKEVKVTVGGCGG